MTKRSPLDGWYTLRFKILERDNFTCRYCGQSAPNVMLEVDHVIPVCEGGSDEPANLVTACRACNLGKEGLRTRRLHAKARQPILRTVLPVYGATQQRQSVLLEHLKRKGPLSVLELEEATGWSRATVKVAVSRLAKNGRVQPLKQDGSKMHRWAAVA